MCGRIYNIVQIDSVRKFTRGEQKEIKNLDKITPCYNAAPTRHMAVIVQSDQQEIQVMKWGMLIPNTVDMVVNARLEEITQKPMFRNLVERQRCVVAINGYYEWTEPKKIPYLLVPKELKMSEKKFELKNSKMKVDQQQEFNNNQVLFVAGVYRSDSFVIITMDSSQTQISKIHHRMPLFLDQSMMQLWLDPNVSYEFCFEAVMQSQGVKADQVEYFEVSNFVNSIRNQGPTCTLPIAEYQKFQHSQGLGRFFKPQKEETKGSKQSKKLIKLEESKRIEDVVQKSNLLSKQRKDTVEEIHLAAQSKAKQDIASLEEKIKNISLNQ